MYIHVCMHSKTFSVTFSGYLDYLTVRVIHWELSLLRVLSLKYEQVRLSPPAEQQLHNFNVHLKANKPLSHHCIVRDFFLSKSNIKIHEILGQYKVANMKV